MVTLYVTSSERGSGKTAISAGIGRHLRASGKILGFFKPIIANPEDIDNDAAFLKQAFSLEEPVELICPVISSNDRLADKLKEAYAKVSPGKDVVIIEGPYEPGIPEALGAKVIIVEDYSRGLSEAKVEGYKNFGESLLGVVLNKIPENQAERIQSDMSSQLGKAGINILGVLPEDRALLALTVSELAEHIQGKILNNAETSAELVENLMLGALCVDPGPMYFGRKANKVVVVRGDRPDMQLAALETPTRGLVLSGNKAPIQAVLSKAKDKKIPLILAGGDTAAIVTGIEDALNKTRFHQEGKLLKFAEIMEQHFDFPALDKGLGLTR